MDLFSLIYANPLYVLGIILAVYAAFGFVYFLAGVLPGIHHAILMDYHKEHMAHYRHRAAAGLGLMVEAFMVWEILVLVANWLVGEPVTNGGLVGFLITVYILILILSFITGSKPKTGH